MTKILCLGNATWDKFYSVPEIPSQATKYFSNYYYEVGGGVAATAAVAVARLGVPASVICRLGDDSVGKLIFDDLQLWGVETNFIKIYPSISSSNAVVHVDNSGERQITVHRDLTMPNDPSWITEDMLDNVSCILCDCTWLEGLQHILSLAKERGIPSVIDVDLGGESLIDVMPFGDHIAFSYPALCQLTGETDEKKALKIAQTYTQGTVYVTRGEKGCYWLQENELKHLPAYKVNVTDTTGAGDVFHGALAVAIAEGMSDLSAVEFASAVAAKKCTQPGGRAGIPNRDQVDAFMRDNVVN